MGVVELLREHFGGATDERATVVGRVLQRFARFEDFDQLTVTRGCRVEAVERFEGVGVVRVGFEAALPGGDRFFAVAERTFAQCAEAAEEHALGVRVLLVLDLEREDLGQIRVLAACVVDALEGFERGTTLCFERTARLVAEGEDAAVDDLRLRVVLQVVGVDLRLGNDDLGRELGFFRRVGSLAQDLGDAGVCAGATADVEELAARFGVVG